MENILKRALDTTKLCSKGYKKCGTISVGETYETDHGRVFVKCNSGPEARLMYEGEVAGLEQVAATGTVAVPRPITVVDDPGGGACLVTEHIDNTVLHERSAELGEGMARLHLHNQSLMDAHSPGSVPQFGFHKTTFHKRVPQDNAWKTDWPTFFVENRLDPQFEMIEKKKKDEEALYLWSKLRGKVPSLFEDVEVKPSLLHGDLWGGNVGETPSHPVIFDLASVFYGHHEYDIAVSMLWGGFTPVFYTAYHSLVPQTPGFHSRKKLYQLFQYLHHWNGVGNLHRNPVLNLMRSLLR